MTMSHDATHVKDERIKTTQAGVLTRANQSSGQSAHSFKVIKYFGALQNYTEDKWSGHRLISNMKPVYIAHAGLSFQLLAVGHHGPSFDLRKQHEPTPQWTCLSSGRMAQCLRATHHWSQSLDQVMALVKTCHKYAVV